MEVELTGFAVGLKIGCVKEGKQLRPWMEQVWAAKSRLDSVSQKLSWRYTFEGH